MRAIDGTYLPATGGTYLSATGGTPRASRAVLEAKRLQGFPDDFIIPVSDAQAYKQLGNSVSVPIIKMIMKNMIKTYEKENKK